MPAGDLPDPGQGYCTDDVARAAIVDVLHGRELGRRGGGRLAAL